jgi:outer membrane protein assembly factor BamB
VADSVKDFDREQIPGEAALAPAEGDRVGELSWKRLELRKPPDYERWGTTELDWIDLAGAVGYKPNQVAYAHAYLHCRRAGRASVVVDHAHGMKAWVNGKAAYANAQRGMGLGNYVGISRQKRDLVNHRSPRFQMDLEKGWNRLLVKIGSYNRKGWRAMKFAPRFLDAGPFEYADRNVLWATSLPERTNASPVIVRDRIFTPAEPDELLCLDKGTGRILWRRINGHYEATPETRRAANPVFQEKIEPLVERLAEETDYERSLELRRRIRDLLIGVDEKKYRMKWDGHLAAHFGIVGFTTTPVSDGERVCAFFGQGVVACYDLGGRRKWIRRLDAPEIRYSCSPAMIGGKVICLFGGLHALDARTGDVAWTRPGVRSIASLIPARIRGTDVVFTRSGEAYRVSDGKLLWANPHIRKGDTGWAAPAVVDDVMYLPWTGIGGLIVADFSRVTGDDWKPKLRMIAVAANHRRPNGEWLDRWTAGSPVIHEGVYYGIDQYGVCYAVDLKAGKTLYAADAGFDELHHYNAIGVGASVALGGRRLYAMDNQGTCVVYEPGAVFKPVAVNRIETVIRRDWPTPPQEILSNAAPVFDGRRMYIRGEQHLYCIAER